MEQTLARFVHALRNADVVVSPAETLDALAVMRAVGIDDRNSLRHGLSLALAKSEADKQRFDQCFERFFSELSTLEKPKRSLLGSFEHEALLNALERAGQHQAREVAAMVLHQQTARLAWRVQDAAIAGGVREIRVLREKNRIVSATLRGLHMDALRDLQHGGSGDAVSGAAYVMQYLTAQVRHFVDLHFELNAEETSRKRLLNAVMAQNLATISPGYLREVERAVSEFAEQLSRRIQRRRFQAHSGTLDVRRLLRRNVAYDGHMFKLDWRRVRKRPGRVFVLCDVSGSVASVARFLLLVLHRLGDALPEVRAFAFSNRLGEVTEQFAQMDAPHAIEAALFEWGHGNSDYGRAWLDFRECVGTALDHRSTVIVLGDGRSNYYEPHVQVFAGLARRARQLIWLSTEGRSDWDSGDSQMRSYAPFCTHVHRLQNLADLKRFTRLLVSST